MTKYRVGMVGWSSISTISVKSFLASCGCVRHSLKLLQNLYCVGWCHMDRVRLLPCNDWIFFLSCHCKASARLDWQGSNHLHVALEGGSSFWSRVVVRWPKLLQAIRATTLWEDVNRDCLQLRTVYAIGLPPNKRTNYRCGLVVHILIHKLLSSHDTFAAGLSFCTWYVHRDPHYSRWLTDNFDLFVLLLLIGLKLWIDRVGQCM